LIEAVEYADGHPGIAVQWHPENLAEKSAGAQALFDWLVKTAASARSITQHPRRQIGARDAALSVLVLLQRVFYDN
jgi:hypothetical protein